MLSIRDCLDYCDLTDDEVHLFAENAHIPAEAAAQILCGMVQSREGVLTLTQFIQAVIEQARAEGDQPKTRQAMRVYNRFVTNHPPSSAAFH